MNKKLKKLDIVVIGSGLASLSFIDKYLEKKRSIDIISPNFHFKYNQSKQNNKSSFYQKKFIPESMFNRGNEIINYFHLNNLSISKNIKPLGSLEFGGLSNYWGLQIDGNFKKDISCLNMQEQKEINKSFYEVLNKFKFLGNFFLGNLKYQNSYFTNTIFENLKEIKSKKYKFYNPILALFKTSNNKNYKRFNAREFFKNFLKKKKIKLHNYLVQKVFFYKNKTKLECYDGKKKFYIYAKKVIFACGTLITTKLIMEALSVKKEVKIYEHPRFLALFFSKKKLLDNLRQNTSLLNVLIKNKKIEKNFVADFRPGNSIIVKTLLSNYIFLKPFKVFLNILKNFMIFSNILIHSNYSNLFLKKKNNKFLIYEKKTFNLENIKEQKNSFKKIFDILKKLNLVFPIYKIFFSKNGSSYHYFGTIPISKKNINLSVNSSCQLKKYKNNYIIDGSVFNFKENKFPLGVIMANARRIAKKF